MSIPLVQKPDKDDINTSIIAIKRNIERINMLLGLSNSEEIDTSKFATKEELQQAVTDLQPVDEVAIDNMQSVTSNAVAERLGNQFKILECGVFSPISINAGSHVHTEITLSHTYKLGAKMGFILTPVSYTDTAYITVTGHWGTIGQNSQSLTQANKLTIYVTNTYSGFSQTCGSYWAIYGKDSDIVN